jgi:hypothetical protein
MEEWRNGKTIFFNPIFHYSNTPCFPPTTPALNHSPRCGVFDGPGFFTVHRKEQQRFINLLIGLIKFVWAKGENRLFRVKGTLDLMVLQAN